MWNFNHGSNIRNNWEECAANTFLGKYYLDKPLSEDLVAKAEKIKEFYFGQNEVSLGSNGLQTFTNAFTDHGFFYGTDVLAR